MSSSPVGVAAARSMSGRWSGLRTPAEVQRYLAGVRSSAREPKLSWPSQAPSSARRVDQSAGRHAGRPIVAELAARRARARFSRAPARPVSALAEATGPR